MSSVFLSLSDRHWARSSEVCSYSQWFGLHLFLILKLSFSHYLLDFIFVGFHSFVYFFSYVIQSMSVTWLLSFEIQFRSASDLFFPQNILRQTKVKVFFFETQILSPLRSIVMLMYSLWTGAGLYILKLEQLSLNFNVWIALKFLKSPSRTRINFLKISPSATNPTGNFLDYELTLVLLRTISNLSVIKFRPQL